MKDHSESRRCHRVDRTLVIRIALNARGLLLAGPFHNFLASYQRYSTLLQMPIHYKISHQPN